MVDVYGPGTNLAIRQSVLYALAPSQVCEVPTFKIAIEMSMNPAIGIVFSKSLMESKSSVYQRKGASRDLPIQSSSLREGCLPGTRQCP